MKREEAKRKREIEVIRKDAKVTHCYIRKGGYYYRDRYCGYTESVTSAGVYTKDEAIKEAEFCEAIMPVSINTENHNKRINTEIEALKARIIQV